MNDLRQILAQGRKRIGLLLGAGAPASILVNAATQELDDNGAPLIPTVNELTKIVLGSLEDRRAILEKITADLTGKPNIEQILTQARRLGEALCSNKVHGLDGPGYTTLADDICKKIGEVVGKTLPTGITPFSIMAGWVGGTVRDHAVEIFTPNYDLLIEEAFERARIPFFDGFSGAVDPFFDSATIANENLPPQWARVWKLHGSLGWGTRNGQVVRGLGRATTDCIYPTHLKYDQVQRLPYSAFMRRLRKFVESPDSLLITCGFSFCDSHLSSLLDEALSANPGATVLALQHGIIEDESMACAIADRRANMGVYARDGAVIGCMHAPWQVGDLLHKAWAPIRDTFWNQSKDRPEPSFLLGDYVALANYLAMTRAKSEALDDPAEEGTKVAD